MYTLLWHGSNVNIYPEPSSAQTGFDWDARR